MPKPKLNPVNYELRNELPVVVSDEQGADIAAYTARVNQQLDWVAQALGWSGSNYWTNLPKTVHQKRALLGGTFGVYNSYTILPLVEVRTVEVPLFSEVEGDFVLPSEQVGSYTRVLVTERRPNVEIGQRLIIGDQEAYIYSLDGSTDTELVLNIGELTDEILTLLQSGAAIKVDIPENRPFPFYRPEPLASADASFRCSTGDLIRETDFYIFRKLVLCPFDQNNALLPYFNLNLIAGSYVYFDRAVYLSNNEKSLAPWVTSEWVPSRGLWKIYVHPEFVGNEVFLVWKDTDDLKKTTVAYTQAQVVPWTDPSDWGNGGKGFNPVLDEYRIEKSYDVAGLNYSLGTLLVIGNSAPYTDNPLWFSVQEGLLRANSGGQWIEVGVSSEYVQLTGASSPPPVGYGLLPGTIWQDPLGGVYIWDPPAESLEPEEFYYHDPDYVMPLEGFQVFDTIEDSGGFYVSDPVSQQPEWWKVDFSDDVLFSSVFTPAYGSNLFVLVNGERIPNLFETTNYTVRWDVRGDYLYVEYVARNDEGETVIPRIAIGTENSGQSQRIDISSDFALRPEVVTSIPHSELGILNNFRGVWGNKGGPRSMDFAFDALDIHGFSEQEALWLKNVDRSISFDVLLNMVTGCQIYTGNQPPGTASPGDYYWNDETGALSIYFLDNDRNGIWLEVNYPASPCQIGTPGCPYIPLKPILSSGSCILDNGDLWQDPNSEAVTIYYESPDGRGSWAEVNWNPEQYEGWEPSESPNPSPDFDSLIILLTDKFVVLEAGVPYETPDYTFTYYTIPEDCVYRFTYVPISPAAIQTFPDVWVAPNGMGFVPVSITQEVFSDLEYFLAPAVQNAACTLRPWKTRSLEVTDGVELYEDTYYNPLTADTNLGPGDENWDRYFVRLPSEYGRKGTVWTQTDLVMQDFAYFGGTGALRPMKCPSETVKPQIYEQVFFEGKDPSQGTVLFSEPFLYSDAAGYNEPFDVSARNVVASVDGFDASGVDFSVVDQFDGWQEADMTEYDPLHFRTVIPGTGEWAGEYFEHTGERPLSGYVEDDLRVKSIVEVPPPVWDASIYKYPPLCPQGEISYVEDPNNYKIGYAYFSADLAAAEDGFFDPSQDVSWRTPLEEDQTLYILQN